MGGVLVSGNNANTRGNIGRGVMRTAVTNFRNSFNWGLMTYGLSGGAGLYNTYVYYLGSDTGMVFTANCTGYVAGVFNGAPAIPGVSTDGGGRCVPNPQWVATDPAAMQFITFNYTSDDSNIVDVLYMGWRRPAAAVGSRYQYEQSHVLPGLPQSRQSDEYDLGQPGRFRRFLLFQRAVWRHGRGLSPAEFRRRVADQPFPFALSAQRLGILRQRERHRHA